MALGQDVDKMKFGFVAMHPGSANALSPIIEKLTDGINEIHLFPVSAYAKNLWKTSAVYNNKKSITNLIPKDLDFLLYSPVGGIESEINLVNHCKENNITSIAVLDIFWNSNTELRKRFLTQPDIIITPDESTAIQLKQIGVASEIHALGNPWFKVNTYYKPSSKIKSIAFISVPVGLSNECRTHIKTLDVLRKIIDNDRLLIDLESIVICKHPRELDTDIVELINKSNTKLNLELNNKFNTTDACSSVDAVVGVNSTVLVEEFLKGNNVIFHSSIEETIHLLNNPQFISHYNEDIQVVPDALNNIVGLMVSKLHRSKSLAY